MLNIRRLLCALLVLCAAGAAAAPGALASHTETVYFEAPNELLSPVTRAATFARLQGLGIRALRLELYWHEVAPDPGSIHRPAFDATDPASYNWSQYDPIVEEADRLGWRILLTVTSPVPRWATADPASGSLVTRPDSQQFEEFMTAVGRHYGSEVSMFAIWNEPNHRDFLLPQFNSNGTPASPRIYRGLYEAGYAGLQAAGIAHPRVLIGETAPGGETFARPPLRPAQERVAPILFLKDMLCLNRSYRPSGSCSPLKASGFAIHPYAFNTHGPFYVPVGSENVTIGVLGRLSRALDRAASAHAITAHLPIYITEFGIDSTPAKYAVSAAKQAEYDAIAERIAWENPRVASFSQYLLKDDPLSGAAASGQVGFQTGLEYLSGTLKPLFSGFPVPLTVTRSGRGYALWGLVLPAAGATTVTVQVRHGSGAYRTLANVRTSSLGSWTLRSSVAGSSWRVQWTSPAGVRYTGPPIHAY